MGTWKAESDWVYQYHSYLGTERQKLRIELQTCSDMISVYQQTRDEDNADVREELLFCCDICAAKEIADLLVLDLINYCALNGRASRMILKSNQETQE